MNCAAQDLAAQFECSELSAGEICKTAQELTQSFVAIYNTYNLDYVLAAKRITSKTFLDPIKKQLSGGARERQEAELAEHIRLNRRALSRASNVLFDNVKAGFETKERFRTALNIAHCQNYFGLEEMLSEVLAALHLVQPFHEPEKVSDGRLAYESIRRDTWLLKQVGVLSEIY